MRIRDAIVIGATLAGSGMLLYFFCIRPIKELHPPDSGKAERETKQQAANVFADSTAFWKTTALQYRHIADSLMLIPSQTTINDAVTSMHSAPVDSVQRVLLSEPR